MQIVRVDLGVDAAVIGNEVIAVRPGLGYVQTYAALRVLLPLAEPETIMALTEQATPTLHLIRSVE